MLLHKKLTERKWKKKKVAPARLAPRRDIA